MAITNRQIFFSWRWYQLLEWEKENMNRRNLAITAFITTALVLVIAYTQLTLCYPPYRGGT